MQSPDLITQILESFACSFRFLALLATRIQRGALFGVLYYPLKSKPSPTAILRILEASHAVIASGFIRAAIHRLNPESTFKLHHTRRDFQQSL
ncbi:hypothetical protein [Helicobacter zhangjianzhongii]|uniref:Uncharacterized protein n=1 Tax=Helicobacter zhangjianzhongii TaxID=2974574 RepID=A0ACC6FR86_9HELI|nr:MULTISPECIES: hypothetical protein [unclassified Helicobacter]MDL0079429.1 hypothetical protein [Helicobacter sp. CPD2-1]MDL0081670.1 hypothetical protein [Helicobacter sp. XJK30-2]